MRVSLMKNGYSQCVICHYYGDAFLHYAIFVAECEFMSIRDDILSTTIPATFGSKTIIRSVSRTDILFVINETYSFKALDIGSLIVRMKQHFTAIQIIQLS